MFYTTDISVTLWIINMNKKAGVINGRQVRDRTNEVLFMDLRSWDGNIEEIVIDKGKRKKKTVFTDAQIAEIKKIYDSWQSADQSQYKDVPELCKAVKLDGENGIRAKNYSLAPSKYIEFVNHDKQIDAVALMEEVQREILHSISDERETLRLLELAAKEIEG
jgi:type I restriction enzyme M protein